MTYVREQTSAELATHMRTLQSLPGWHDPLADRLWQEVEAIKASNERLRQALQAITAQVEGNILPTIRDCVNGQNKVQDIYGYCDQIDSIAAAAMKEQQP